MSVQIPDGRKGTIHVFPGDDPRDLATNFCTKYELKDPKLQRLVERHILDSMKNLPQARSLAPSDMRVRASLPTPSFASPRLIFGRTELRLSQRGRVAPLPNLPENQPRPTTPSYG